MKSKQVTIKGELYTVRSSTDEGIKKAIVLLKKALKKNKQDNEENYGI